MGNTCIVKPSEKTPLTALRAVEILTEAGLPKGYFISSEKIKSSECFEWIWTRNRKCNFNAYENQKNSIYRVNNDRKKDIRSLSKIKLKVSSIRIR
jgi:hypothetical protein